MARSWLDNLKRLNRNNVETFRSAPWAEISGSLGDLGTLLPLMIALAAQGSINLGTTLVFSGIFNILTGIIYGIPLPVQPMKVSIIPSFRLLRMGRARTNDIVMKTNVHPLRLSLPPPSQGVVIQPWALSPRLVSGLVLPCWS